MRCFLAIELPSDIRLSLSSVISLARKEIPSRASWVREENLHITVRFLGDAYEGTLQQFTDSMQRIAGAQGPVRLRVAKLGVYPNPRHAKVLWCGGEGEIDRLVRFQSLCEHLARECKFDSEKRGWTPHVTLARFRESPPAAQIQHALNTFSSYEAGEFTVAGVTLFSSELSPRGASYKELRKFAFSCPSTSSSDSSTTS